MNRSSLCAWKINDHRNHEIIWILCVQLFRETTVIITKTLGYNMENCSEKRIPQTGHFAEKPTRERKKAVRYVFRAKFVATICKPSLKIVRNEIHSTAGYKSAVLQGRSRRDALWHVHKRIHNQWNRLDRSRRQTQHAWWLHISSKSSKSWVDDDYFYISTIATTSDFWLEIPQKDRSGPWRWYGRYFHVRTTAMTATA